MNPQIKIIQGDITEQETEAIVNAANTDLILGAGVAGAIRTKGGPAIEEECERKGPIPLGEAAMTTGGNLKARFVIHAASMSFSQTTTEKSLRDSTKNSLLRADENKIESVAFPAIGTGVAGFPVDRCAQIMLQEASRFLEAHEYPQKIVFVLFDRQTFDIFQEIFKNLDPDI